MSQPRVQAHPGEGCVKKIGRPKGTGKSASPSAPIELVKLEYIQSTSERLADGSEFSGTT